MPHIAGSAGKSLGRYFAFERLSINAGRYIFGIWNLNISIGKPKTDGLSDTLIFGLII
jgi:hypothetical protein